MVTWIIWALFFAVGPAIGASIAYLFYRANRAAVEERLHAAIRDLRARGDRIETMEAEIRAALDAKARAEQDAKRLPELERHVTDLNFANAELKQEIADLKREQETGKENVRWLEQAEDHLREIFESLASRLLQTNVEALNKHGVAQMDSLLNKARGDWSDQKGEYESLLKPVSSTLATLNDQIDQLERKREGAYEGLEEHLRHLGEAQEQIRTTATTLIQALKTPGVRGSWGNMQLRRIVEMAGLKEHVDFNEPPSANGEHPDMILHLPNNGILPVDSKISVQAYIDAMGTDDADLRDAKIEEHSQAIRQRILELGLRRFWQQFESTPELIALFVPNDASLGAAFEHDPDLLEFGIQHGVLLTAPVTLLALLKAVAYGWKHHQVAENARQIAIEGKQLYERLSTFLGFLNDLGKRLDRTVRDYNRAADSLQGQVFPAARRLKEMGVVTMGLPRAVAIESQVKTSVSPDLEEVVEERVASS